MVILRVVGGLPCEFSARGFICGSYLMVHLDRECAGCDGVRGARSFDGRVCFDHCRSSTRLGWIAILMIILFEIQTRSMMILFEIQTRSNDNSFDIHTRPITGRFAPVQRIYSERPIQFGLHHRSHSRPHHSHISCQRASQPVKTTSCPPGS